jgi:asparagine synthase (glutamine-hydrolysing)
VDLIGDFLLSAAELPRKGENHSSSFHEFWQSRCFQPELLSILQQTDHRDVARFSQLYEEATSEHPLERWLEVDQRLYLPEDILTKVDIASMAVSLECRCPFLDHRLAEFTNQLPIQTKLQGSRTKILLRLLASRQVPPSVATLPKRGFVIPLATWLREGLKDWAYSILFQRPSSWQDYLKPEVIQVLWETHQSGYHDHSKRLWTVIAWALWSEAVKYPSP